jgi:hypothetical protein
VCYIGAPTKNKGALAMGIILKKTFCASPSFTTVITTYPNGTKIIEGDKGAVIVKKMGKK